MGGLRELVVPFVVTGPSGVAVRTRLKGHTPDEEEVLRLVGAHLGSLASRDLKARCTDGLEHSAESWAARKRELTGVSSSRWAGSITKATHDQWALARRCQLAHIQHVEAGVRTIAHRLSLPVGHKGTKRAAGGYRSRREWHAKARRLRVLEDRLGRVRADRDAGRVRVVRGGRRLARTRHHLADAGLTEAEWRERWEAERWFFQADGESGKRFGNETIRITPEGEVSIKLPASLAYLANAAHGRYVLATKVSFAHRGSEWADRVAAHRAVAYRIHHDAGRLDAHGNPIGNPRRFFYDLTGTAQHRDAQVRHALTRLLHWAKACGVKAIAIEDLDFQADKTWEKHGSRRRFRQLISGMPTGKLRARLTSMADATGITIIAVDPAYTSKWGAQYWQKPLTSTTRKTSRHDAASIAIGRRAQGHPIRRRTTPPRAHQSDVHGHRTVQAGPGTPGREGPRPRIPGPRTRCVPPDAERKRATSASKTVRDAPSRTGLGPKLTPTH